MTKHNNIMSQISSIVAKCTGIPEDALEPDLFLTGRVFKLSAVDLIYILFEIEKEFNIHIPYDALEQYGFSTISSISSSVQQILEHK